MRLPRPDRASQFPRIAIAHSADASHLELVQRPHTHHTRPSQTALWLRRLPQAKNPMSTQENLRKDKLMLSRLPAEDIFRSRIPFMIDERCQNRQQRSKVSMVPVVLRHP